jgi:hypothetical protein
MPETVVRDDVIPGGGDGGFEVDRAALRGAGEQIRENSAGIRPLASHVSSACAAAASGCGGWRIAAASSAAAARWDRVVSERATEVDAAGGKLITSADNYASVEALLVTAAAGAGGQAVGGG